MYFEFVHVTREFFIIIKVNPLVYKCPYMKLILFPTINETVINEN